MTQPNDWVVVEVARSEPEAELLCSLLRSAGIECVPRLTNRGAGAGDGLGTVGPYDIVVSPRDAHDARHRGTVEAALVAEYPGRIERPLHAPARGAGLTGLRVRPVVEGDVVEPAGVVPGDRVAEVDRHVVRRPLGGRLRRDGLVGGARRRHQQRDDGERERPAAEHASILSRWTWTDSNRACPSGASRPSG